MTEYREPASDSATTEAPATEAGALADEPIPDAWGANGEPGGQGARGREWLSQLETMIQDVATQAAPVARQIAAKAAELAAVAGEKAGPFAQKAAEVTAKGGQRLAERAHQVAADLRAQQAADEAAAQEGQAVGGAGTSPEGEETRQA